MNMTKLKVYFDGETNPNILKSIKSSHEFLYTTKLSPCLHNNLGVEFPFKAKQLIQILNWLADFKTGFCAGERNICDDTIILNDGKLAIDFYNINNKRFIQFLATQDRISNVMQNVFDALYQYFNENRLRYNISDVRYYSPIIVGGGQNG